MKLFAALLVLVLSACVSQPQPASSIWHVSVLWNDSLQPSTLVPWQATTGDEKVSVHTDGQFCQIRMHSPVRNHDPVARSVLGAGLYLCTQGAEGTAFTADEQKQSNAFAWGANWSRGVMSENPYELVKGKSIVGYKSVTTTSQYPTSIDDFAAIQVLGHEAWHYFDNHFHPKITANKFDQLRKL